MRCLIKLNFCANFSLYEKWFREFFALFYGFFRTALLCELFIIPIILVWILLVHKRTMPFTEDHKSIHRSSNFILIFLVTIFCQIILVFVVWIFSRFFFRIMILMVVMMMSSIGSTSRWRRLPGWWFSLGWGDGFLFSDYFLNKQNSFLKNYIYIIVDPFHCFFGKI